MSDATTQLAGTCPECDFTIEAEDLTAGETLACPECLLTLRVDEVTPERALSLTAVEVDLRDWGQ
ncbi:lysine biosynthesis protein LysW [Brevibacterium sp. XM4083]|uniref:lysine biosynthesis protein LysW n=1 Tax=Brevibacterium sp. XM4083 TaxID=2583238 RepID=UPI00112899F3|nr:lysine biosynthesis protein LysW [Brevibacterium sp. XM4083]MCM1011811.1 hypothetical protein [Brevibacterium sp. XM4083]